MDTTLDKKYELKIDKLATIIDKDNYIMPKNISKQGFGIGVNYKETPKGLKLEFSSKLFSTPTSLNALKWANSEGYSDKIYEQTQIIINNDFLINYAPIFRVDAFEDVLVDEILLVEIPGCKQTCYYRYADSSEEHTTVGSFFSRHVSACSCF